MRLLIDPGFALSAQDLIVVLISAICAYTDYRYRKVYDRLTWPVMLLGLILAFVAGSFGGVKSSALGIGVAFGMYVIPCEIGAIGGGDAKFMMAIGSLQGYLFLVVASLFGFALGGVQAFYSICKREHGLKNLVTSITSGSLFTTSYEDRDKEENIPLGIYFALASIICLILRHYQIFF